MMSYVFLIGQQVSVRWFPDNSKSEEY